MCLKRVTHILLIVSIFSMTALLAGCSGGGEDSASGYDIIKGQERDSDEGDIDKSTGTTPGEWSYVSAGTSHTMAINTDGSLWGWGVNSAGQLGIDEPIIVDVLTQISTDNDWRVVSAGNEHTVAIKTDGSLWAWGCNFDGELGDGTHVVKRVLPTRIGTDTDWSIAEAGVCYTAAIKTDGSLWAWGLGASVAFNDIEFYDIIVPTRVGSDTDWATVSTGFLEAVAIKTDGSLWGVTHDWSGLTQIGGDTDWETVSARMSTHAVAIKNDGSLWAWGSNNTFGMLGDGTTVGKDIPTRIGADSDWQAASAGMIHSVAIKTDGSLWAWGSNTFGMLGDGTEENKLVPTRIGTAADWDMVSAGSYTLAIKTDGSMWAWGYTGSNIYDINFLNSGYMPVQIQ